MQHGAGINRSFSNLFCRLNKSGPTCHPYFFGTAYRLQILFRFEPVPVACQLCTYPAILLFWIGQVVLTKVRGGYRPCSRRIDSPRNEIEILQATATYAMQRDCLSKSAQKKKYFLSIYLRTQLSFEPFRFETGSGRCKFYIPRQSVYSVFFPQYRLPGCTQANPDNISSDRRGHAGYMHVRATG